MSKCGNHCTANSLQLKGVIYKQTWSLHSTVRLQWWLWSIQYHRGNKSLVGVKIWIIDFV